ncbi:DUF4012 domain-containing protein [Arthrobacter sp. FW305-BF8]|uniref:DUF4012 domain-containing protein n=1 Tax=Arthrobacter sp. FW305-BF8 TaxID=2879617 RepID=UPI001F3D0F9C|nr:DUF4012 domain-containing protein [Arthrobacter sp. FW305-BF8]UKA53469.1 DUF4012 domain-containing protein [Arthrobacter sp. FW305-BF8]
MARSRSNSKIESSAHTGDRTNKGSKRRRILLLAVGLSAVAIILMLLSAVWLSSKASTINTELTAAKQLVPALRANIVQDDAAAATAIVKDLHTHTILAREAATDPLWTLAGELPWLGANFSATREIATSADDVVSLGAAPLVRVANTLDWKLLATGSQKADLRPLAEAEPTLTSAANAVRQSSERLNGIDAGELVPQIATPLLTAREELSALGEQLDTAADAAKIMPSMMGGKEPRRYLLLIQNNAELRATGGIPGALAVLTVEDGRLSLGSQTSASALGPFSPVEDVDAEQSLIYSTRLGKFMQDVNLTPDFPTAAETARAMWKTRTGQQLDGVLSVDPVALAYMLDATGPVRLNTEMQQEIGVSGLPSELTGKNVVSTLLSDVYSRIMEPAKQDAYFAGVAQEVFAKVSGGTGNTAQLLGGISRAASEHRLQLWSSDDREQSVIAQYPLGGSVTGTSISPAQFGVYFNDGTGAKMDFHVKRTVQLIRECPAEGYSQVRVKVTSTNVAPKDAGISLPEYVTGGGSFGVPAGSVQTNIVAYGPVQSNVENALLDTKKTGFASNRHAGRPVGTVTVRLAPGQSRTVEFTFGKIVQHTDPVVAVTPTVQSLKDVILETGSAACTPAP